MIDHIAPLPWASSPALSPGGPCLPPEQLRERAAWFRQFPHQKAQRAAQLAELAAKTRDLSASG